MPKDSFTGWDWDYLGFRPIHMTGGGQTSVSISVKNVHTSSFNVRVPHVRQLTYAVIKSALSSSDETATPSSLRSYIPLKSEMSLARRFVIIPCVPMATDGYQDQNSSCDFAQSYLFKCRQCFGYYVAMNFESIILDTTRLDVNVANIGCREKPHGLFTGSSFRITVSRHYARTDTYTNLFSIKMRYAGRFTDCPNKHVEGYEDDDDLVLHYKIPMKSLDIGLKPLDSFSDINNFLGYVNKHKMMYVYVEKVKKTESSSNDEGEDDSKSEDDGEDDIDFIVPIQPNVNVTEDDLEVLDFDLLESDQDDENARSRGLRMLRKKHKSSGISKNFYIGKEFPNMDLAKERIRAYATLNSMNEYVDKVQGSKRDTSRKGKARCNPDTIVKIDVYGKEDPEKTTRMFKRIYVCLGALKRGFKEGGRELLGLDGAFIRGKYPGQMFTAVGVDANNGIYLVAYGIVESENQYSWTWFLKCLADDFDLFSLSFPGFNRQLLEDMDGLIITALEYVREYLMKRIFIVQKVIEKSDGPLTPAVTKLFNKIKEAANNGMNVGTPKDWVHESHKLQTWMNIYSHKINLVNRRDMWSNFECPKTLLPPKVHPQIGRPFKKRKKSKGEIAIVKGDKLTRKGKTVTCSNCKGIGHNKRGCKATGSSDGGQRHHMPSDTVPSQPLGSQQAASQGMSTQPLSSQAGPSEPVARIFFTKKSFARKYVTRNKSTSEVIQAAQPATQGLQATRPCSQAARPYSQAAPTSPTIKRTKISACRLTPDKK
uniref:MULE transposase domain-containing protein n=1 Tax=Tanacetum cinerariifolium TaxID=118510 RepID=A0A6L2JAE3_TANCI|nr:hypothetical protein [Tanacetum cinerariifolium]